MSNEGTGATPEQTTPPVGATSTATETPDPREDALGDKGKELLKELRRENRELATTVKELSAKFTETETAATKAAREKAEAAERDRKAAEDAKLTSIERLEKRLQEEQAERIRFQEQYQERVVRDDFMSRVRVAGIRDDAAAEDLYQIIKDGLTLDSITKVIEREREQRAYFFKEKRGTQGHGGSAGTGGDGKGPLITADESRFAKLAGVKPEDYVKARGQG